MTRHEHYCSWIGKEGLFYDHIDNYEFAKKGILIGLHYNDVDEYKFVNEKYDQYKYFKLTVDDIFIDMQIVDLEREIKDLEQYLTNVHEMLDHLRTELVNIKSLGGK